MLFSTFLYFVILSFYLWLFTPEKDITSAKFEVINVPINQTTVQKEIENTIPEYNTLDNEKSTEQNLQHLPDNSKNNCTADETNSDNSKSPDSHEFDISTLKIYKYRGFQMIKIADLPKDFVIPPNTKTYTMKKHKVIKLSALQI